MAGRLRSNELQPRTLSGLPPQLERQQKETKEMKRVCVNLKCKSWFSSLSSVKNLYCIAGGTPAITVRQTCLSAVRFMSRLGLD
jgi:hypothetical protein